MASAQRASGELTAANSKICLLLPYLPAIIIQCLFLWVVNLCEVYCPFLNPVFCAIFSKYFGLHGSIPMAKFSWPIDCFRSLWQNGDGTMYALSSCNEREKNYDPFKDDFDHAKPSKKSVECHTEETYNSFFADLKTNSQVLKIQDFQFLLRKVESQSIKVQSKNAETLASSGISKGSATYIEEGSHIFPGLANVLNSLDTEGAETFGRKERVSIERREDFTFDSTTDNFLLAGAQVKSTKKPMENDCSRLLLDYVSQTSDRPTDGSTTQGKTTSSNSKQSKGQELPSSGSPIAEVGSRLQKSSTGGSGGSGGDDGGEDRRPRMPAGGCKGDAPCGDDKEEDEKEKLADEEEKNAAGMEQERKEQCRVENVSTVSEEQEECLPCEVKEHPLDESTVPTGMAASTSTDASNLLANDNKGTESNKKSPKPVNMSSSSGTNKKPDQGLRVDVAGARLIASSECTASSEPVHRPSLRDQSRNQIQRQADRTLLFAFNCRHKFRSEAAWEQCGDTCCRELQDVLTHTHNCRLRVLGGCQACLQYQQHLYSHTTTCALPLGKCVVQNCDSIRDHVEKNGLPVDASRWTYQLDQLFFNPSPPQSPVSPDSPALLHTSGGEPADQELTALQAQAIAWLALNPAQPIKESSLGLQDEAARTSWLSRPSPSVSGEWNQYHLDRPPDSPGRNVARGPSIPNDDGPEEPVRASITSSVSEERRSIPSTKQRRQEEVLWPLNKEKISVAEDGSYIKGVHWLRKQYIGGGSCGRCFMCQDRASGFLFAIKLIPVSRFERSEVEIWGSLSGQHPNILELYGAVRDEKYVTIYMEYMEGGSLEDIVGRLNEGSSLYILEKVIAAVAFMHFCGIVHRDIKGGNVLVDATGHRVKLADFGTAVRLCDGQLWSDYSPRGTEAFMAPEVCRSKPHSFSADVWSLMCLLYQMLQGQPPWMDRPEFRHAALLFFKIGMASEPPQSPPCSPEVEDFFSQGFKMEPELRATATFLLQHRVFQTVPDASMIHIPSGQRSDGEDVVDSDDSDVVSDGDSDESDGSDTGSDGDDDDDDDEVDSPLEPVTRDANQERLEQDLLAGTAGQQLESLQSSLYLSLQGENLDELIAQVTEDLDDNDVNRGFSEQDSEVTDIIDQICAASDMPSTQPFSSSAVSIQAPEWSYSMTDLTKIDILDARGNPVFTIREKPSKTYGSLGEDLHGTIASVMRQDAFSLASEDGLPLNVRTVIGSQHQAIRVIPAHDTDCWQQFRWRIDVHGLLEQLFEF